MPFTTAQISEGARYAIKAHEKNTPVDQINVKHVTLDWLIRNKKPGVYANAYVTENVYISNDSNYQNYHGADQVTHNSRDPVRQAEYTYGSAFDGFYFDEDTLLNKGIQMTDDNTASPTKAEALLLADIVEESYRACKESIQLGLAYEALRDGTQSTNAFVGLDALVSTTPTTGTVGGLNAATFTWWRNNANLSITQANLATEMEKSFQACIRYGNMGAPDFLVAGQGFCNAYRAAAGQTINRQIMVGEKGGVGMDMAVTNLFFRGIPILWDPTFEELDTVLGAITHPWTRRCYFLNSKALKLRPVKGHWMVQRKPERLPDRFVHYFGKTTKQGMTTNKRNAHAVLSWSGS